MAIDLTTDVSAPAGEAYHFTASDTLRLLPGVTLTAESGPGIWAEGANQRIQVFGRIVASTIGIDQSGTGTPEETFVLTVEKAGWIAGDDIGVRLAGSAFSVSNHGLIFGDTAIETHFAGEGYSTFLNTGTLLGRAIGYALDQAAGETLFLNEGIVATAGFAFRSLGQSNDVLVNRGSLIGDVDLGAGNDRFDGLVGKVTGKIQGGAGNDLFLLGRNSEAIDGGGDRDTIDLRSTSGVRLALDGGFGGSGVAAGDTFAGIEVIWGSRYGRDTLRGDGASNALYGNGGNDQMIGMAGDDRLIGGLGRDALRGGGGNDAFVFSSLREGGDRLLDFSNLSGNDDVIELRAAAFGHLPTGALAAGRFRVARGNQGLDADDRFILRKADRSLWFDPDGRGAKDAILIADLPNKIMLSLNDFLLV